MGPVSVTATIDAPREEVWKVVSDLAYRPAFCDHFQLDYRLQRIGSTGIGASARFRAEATRFPIWMETVITELEAPHRIVETGRGSRADRMRIGTAWELVDGAGATTELTVTFWAEAEHPVDSALGKLGAARWYEKQWKKALGRLRTMAENGETIEPLRVAGMSRI